MAHYRIPSSLDTFSPAGLGHVPASEPFEHDLPFFFRGSLHTRFPSHRLPPVGGPDHTQAACPVLAGSTTRFSFFMRFRQPDSIQIRPENRRPTSNGIRHTFTEVLMVSLAVSAFWNCSLGVSWPLFPRRCSANAPLSLRFIQRVS